MVNKLTFCLKLSTLIIPIAPHQDAVQGPFT